MPSMFKTSFRLHQLTDSYSRSCLEWSVLVPKERIHARYLYYTLTINVPVVYMMGDIMIQSPRAV